MVCINLIVCQRHSLVTRSELASQCISMQLSVAACQTLCMNPVGYTKPISHVFHMVLVKGVTSL